MIHIDGEPIDWSRWGNAKKTKELYSRPRTWTVPPGLIKLNPYSNQLETPVIGMSTRYQSNFRYGNNDVLARHTVLYFTSERPHKLGETPTYVPQSILIPAAGFISAVIDPEINFYLSFAPWTEDGVAYDPNHRKRCYEYNSKRHMELAETEADITMKVLDRVRSTSVSNAAELVAMAKALVKNAGTNTGIKIDEQLLNARETDDNRLQKADHLAQLKNQIWTFTVRNPRRVRDLLNTSDAKLFGIIEECTRRRMLEFVRENSTPTMQGRWVFSKDDGGKADLCVVSIDERPTERLYQFLSSPQKSEEKASEEAYGLLLRAYEEKPVLA
jgi:hypothetical protein